MRMQLLSADHRRISQSLLARIAFCITFTLYHARQHFPVRLSVTSLGEAGLRRTRRQRLGFSLPFHPLSFHRLWKTRRYPQHFPASTHRTSRFSPPHLPVSKTALPGQKLSTSRFSVIRKQDICKFSKKHHDISQDVPPRRGSKR